MSRIVAPVMLGLLLSSPHVASAQALLRNACDDEARAAQHVAQDRDAGASRQAELDRIKVEAAAMPLDARELALTQLPKIVQGLYGRYAALPAAQVYPRYFAFCLHQGQASRQRLLEGAAPY